MSGKKLCTWIGWFVFLFILDFAVPYGLLNNVGSLSGSFLFWTVWGLVAIGSMWLMVRGWREGGEA